MPLVKKGRDGGAEVVDIWGRTRLRVNKTLSDTIYSVDNLAATQ